MAIDTHILVTWIGEVSTIRNYSIFLENKVHNAVRFSKWFVPFSRDVLEQVSQQLRPLEGRDSARGLLRCHQRYLTTKEESDERMSSSIKQLREPKNLVFRRLTLAACLWVVLLVTPFVQSPCLATPNVLTEGSKQASRDEQQHPAQYTRRVVHQRGQGRHCCPL